MIRILRTLLFQLPAAIIGAFLALLLAYGVYVFTPKLLIPASEHRAEIEQAHMEAKVDISRAACRAKAEGIARGIGSARGGIGDLTSIGVEVADFGTPPTFKPTNHLLRCQIVISSEPDEILSSAKNGVNSGRVSAFDHEMGVFPVYPEEFPDQMFVNYYTGKQPAK